METLIVRVLLYNSLILALKIKCRDNRLYFKLCLYFYRSFALFTFTIIAPFFLELFKLSMTTAIANSIKVYLLNGGMRLIWAY